MTGTKSKRNRQRDGIRSGGATPHLGRQVVRVPPDGWLVILFLLDDTPVRSPRQRRRGITFLADLIVGRSSPFHWLADDGKTKELGTQVGAFVRPLSEPAMATIQKCTWARLAQLGPSTFHIQTAAPKTKGNGTNDFNSGWNLRFLN